MKKKIYFWGYKDRKTGLFYGSYITARYKRKTACFKTELNARRQLGWQPYKHKVEISKIVEIMED